VQERESRQHKAARYEKGVQACGGRHSMRQRVEGVGQQEVVRAEGRQWQILHEGACRKASRHPGEEGKRREAER